MVGRDEEDEGFEVGEVICIFATDAAIKCKHADGAGEFC